MTHTFEAATLIASQVAGAYASPTTSMINMTGGQGGIQLAKALVALADERVITFGKALIAVLEDERVASVGKNDSVRDEAVTGFLTLQEG